MSAVEYDWLYRHDTDGAAAGLTYAHMAHIERCPVEGQTLLAAAWQASSAGCEGDAKQHLRFSTSRDGGKTWCVHAVEPRSSPSLTPAVRISPTDSLTTTMQGAVDVCDVGDGCTVEPDLALRDCHSKALPLLLRVAEGDPPVGCHRDKP